MNRAAMSLGRYGRQYLRPDVVAARSSMPRPGSGALGEWGSVDRWLPPPDQPEGVEVAVVDDDVGPGEWVSFGDVEALGDSVPIAVEGLGLVGAFPCCVSKDAAMNRELSLDLDPDSQVPAVVELGAEREHTIDDEDAVGWHGGERRGVVDLGDGVDAAQRDLAGARDGRGLEEQCACRIEVEGIAVVALP